MVSEGTRARQRAATQLASVARFPTATGASEAAKVLDENAATPHRVSRARDAGERRLRDLNARSASLEAAAKALKSGASRAGEPGDGRKGGTRDSADATEKSDTLEKWRAIQTWASVDSVEASQGRGAGTEPRRASDELPALPESLSPITQIAEPPVRVDLGSVQPALERALRFDDEHGGGAAADDALASSHPAWATPTPRRDECRDDHERNLRADVADRVRTPEPNAETRRSVAAVAERFHSFATLPLDEGAIAANGDVVRPPNATGGNGDRRNTGDAGVFNHFELEVTRRREREARDAVDKMDRAVSAMRDERDAARERSATDRAALAAASRRESDARRDAQEARDALSAMRRQLGDVNEEVERLREDARRSAKTREADSEARVAETVSALESTRETLREAREGRRAALEAASSAEAKTASATRRAAEAETLAAETERRLTESRDALERVTDAAGRQLETLREEVSVLRACLSARAVSDEEMARMRAEAEEARETARKSVAGVEGPIAAALARARNALRSAAATDAGPGAAASSAAAGETNALLMDASSAEALAAQCASAADALADRLDDAAEKQADLDRRLAMCAKFEAGRAISAPSSHGECGE